MIKKIRIVLVGAIATLGVSLFLMSCIKTTTCSCTASGISESELSSALSKAVKKYPSDCNQVEDYIYNYSPATSVRCYEVDD